MGILRISDLSVARCAEALRGSNAGAAVGGNGAESVSIMSSSSWLSVCVEEGAFNEAEGASSVSGWSSVSISATT